MNSEADHRFFKVLEQARSWAHECLAFGWLQERDVERFNRIDLRSPKSLFRNTGRRPLVVAFFGGTGVGKSTLLNRLAEHEVAKTGVVRPTSREVSLYLFQDLDLDQLAQNFPLEKIRIERHNHVGMENVLWIDMPDIDSTELTNREIVLEWLPHLDCLIYVVSPERYHDERGWRLLLSEGAKHAWLFVMNHFDQGEPSQLKAFTGQLLKAGFKDPIVLATDCSAADSSQRDDFQQLQETIGGLANRHTILQLESRTMVFRMREIETTIDACVKAMGSPAAIDKVLKTWESIWNDTVSDLDEGIQWPIQQAARTFGIADGGKKLIKKLSTEVRNEGESGSLLSTNPNLWDDWAQTRFEDALDQLAVTAGANGIPVAPFKNGLAQIRIQARKILHQQTELNLRQSLANPGNSIRRLLLTITRICSGLFPLAAIGRVAYEVLNQFHESSTSGGPYLGLDFAIHSGLLIFVAWLLPWFVHKKLKPSTEGIAFKALKNGTRSGYETIQSRIDDTLAKLLDQRSQLINATEKITSQCRHPVFSETVVENKTLSRMLSKQSLPVHAVRK